MIYKEKKRVLFVCLGNICRSPAAESVFRYMVNESGLSEKFQIDSAGTSGYHDGEPADSRMIKHGRKRGYDLTSISRKLSSDDFFKFDYIVTMDERNLLDVRDAAPPGCRIQMVPMIKYLQGMKSSEIPDPYFGGAEGFEHVFDLLEDACEGLLRELTT